MDADDYDDPRIESQWIADQRSRVLEYLRVEGVAHEGVPDRPDWFLAPYLAVWRVVSRKAPGVPGWWAISGDVPTDYMSSGEIRDAKRAMLAFARNWREVSNYMLRGEKHPEVAIGSQDQWPELGDLLRRRAELLTEFAANDAD